MSERILYIDLNGVLVDFERQWNTIFGVPLNNRKEYYDNVQAFVEAGGFETAPETEYFNDVMQAVKEVSEYFDIITFLTSAGMCSKFSESHFEKVKEQKLAWLYARAPKMQFSTVQHAHVVRGTGKKQYANGSTFLLDDSPGKVSSFIEAGGHATLFDKNDVAASLIQFKLMVEKAYGIIHN